MAGKMKHKLMAFMSKGMISCDEASFLISKSYEEKLTFRQKFRLKMHLMSCYLCRRYEKQLGQLNDAVINYKSSCEHTHCEHTLSSEAKVKISQHVIKELNTNS